MARCLEIGLDRPLLDNESWADQLMLILVFCLSLLASIYLLFGWFDLEAHISDIQAAINIAAIRTIDFVSIDTSDQTQATQPCTPDPLARPAPTVLQPHDSFFASSYSNHKVQIPAQWAWERPDWIGRPGEFSQRELPTMPSIFKTESEKSAWYEALAQQPTTAQRRKKRYDDHLFNLAVETPLPKSPLPETLVPESRRQRIPSCASPEYQRAYERFSAIFRQSSISEDPPAQQLSLPPTALAPSIIGGACMPLPESIGSIPSIGGDPPAQQLPPPQTTLAPPSVGGARMSPSENSAVPSIGGDPPAQARPTALPPGQLRLPQTALTPSDIGGAHIPPSDSSDCVPSTSGDLPVQTRPARYSLGGAGASGRTVRFALPPSVASPAPKERGSTTTGSRSSGGDPPAQTRPTTYPPGQLPLPQMPLTPSDIGGARTPPSDSSASAPSTGGDAPIQRGPRTLAVHGSIFDPSFKGI